MWKALRDSTIKGTGNEPQDNKDGDIQTLERPSEPQTSAGATAKLKQCHFLRLPTEIRLQIYAYSDIGGHTIEVIHLPTIQTSGSTQCFRTYSTDSIDHELFYRLECPEDKKFAKPSPNDAPHEPTRKWGLLSSLIEWVAHRAQGTPYSSAEPLKRKRCFSVHELFALTSVCRQIRADTQVLVYELNAFSFTDENHNCGRATRAISSSLTSRELAAVRTIYWPLMSVLVYQQSLHGVELEEPGRSCVEELGAWTGVEKVVLRYFGSAFYSAVVEYGEGQAQELKDLLAEPSARKISVESEYRRTLAVRAMKALVGRKDAEVHCERSWRANF